MAFGFRDDATRLRIFSPALFPSYKAYCLINKLTVTLSLLLYLFLSLYLCLSVSHKLINAAFYSDLRFVYCQPLRPDDGDFGSGFGFWVGDIYDTTCSLWNPQRASIIQHGTKQSFSIHNWKSNVPLPFGRPPLLIHWAKRRHWNVS